ncbi:blaSHV-61_1_AJ866284 [Klebsiella pneumoniae]|nr:blaSHV-61_1_AJ866284 [Klebsiella pneumoniae]
MPRAKIGRVTPVPAQPFFHFRRITLNPAVNRGVIDIHSAFSQHLLQLTVTDAVFAVPAHGPPNDVTLKMPAFEWVHVQLHQQKGMISLSPPTICNSANAGLFLFVASLLAFIGLQDVLWLCVIFACIISLLATLLAVHASPQPLEQIKQSESQLSGRVGMIEMDLASGRTRPPGAPMNAFP